MGLPFDPTNGIVAAFLGEFGADCNEAMSCSGALGKRIPLDSIAGICGDCDGESRGIVNEEMSGELLYDSAPLSDPVDE